MPALVQGSCQLGGAGLVGEREERRLRGGQAMAGSGLRADNSAEMIELTPDSRHRHAVHAVGHLHRLLVVRDDDHLRIAGKLAHHRRETLDVHVVERRVDFVEQIERRRLDRDQREDQRRRRHRALAAGERRRAASASCPAAAPRSRFRSPRDSPDSSATSWPSPPAKSRAYDLGRKRSCDALEGFVELRLRLLLDLLDRFEQRLARPRQIVELRAQEALALG